MPAQVFQTEQIPPTEQVSQTGKHFKNMFKSKLSNACVVVGLLILGVGVEKMIDGEVVAPILIVIGMILVVLRIITDDVVQGALIKLLNSKGMRIFLSTIICISVVGGSYCFSNWYVDTQRSTINFSNGRIMAGSEGMPSFKIIPPDSEPDYKISGVSSIPESYNFVVMLGDNNAIFIKGEPNNTFYLQDYPFLTIKQEKQGGIMFSTAVVGSDNHTIVKVIDNEFKTFEDYSFSSLHPNKSTLVVRDLEGKEVLNINYINKKVLKISGRFYTPYHVVSISSSGIIDTGWGEIYGSHAPAWTGANIYIGGLYRDDSGDINQNIISVGN